MADPILALLQHEDAAQRKRGIAAAAKSGDSRYLKALAQLYKSETNEELRQLARRAGAYLKQQADQAAQAAPPAADPEYLHEATMNALRGDAMEAVQRARQERAAEAPPPVSTSRRPAPSTAEKEQAQVYYDNAFDLHMKGNNARAVLELGTAFHLNPAFANDKTAVALAAELTGLPHAEAVRVISDPDQWRSLTEQHGGIQSERSRTEVQSLALWVVGVIVFIAAVALVVAFMNSELFRAAVNEFFTNLLN